MSLLIRDEKDNVVNEFNPIITEHNGTTGDTVILPMMVENSSPHDFHRNIMIRVDSKPPVDISLNLPTSLLPMAYYHHIEILRLNPKEKALFNLRTIIPAATKKQVITETWLQVTSISYPLP